MLRQYSTRRIVTFFVGDWLGTLALLFLASLVHLWAGLPSEARTLSPADGLAEAAGQAVLFLNQLLPVPLVLLVSIVWPLTFIFFSVYDGRHSGTLMAEVKNVLMAVAAAGVGLAGILYLTYRETPRFLFLTFLLFDVVYLVGTRLALATYRLARHGRSPATRRLIIAGAGLLGQKAVAELMGHAWANIGVVGYADDDPAKQGVSFAGVPVLGSLEQLPALCSANHVHDAVVALPLRAHERLVQTCRLLQAQHVRVYVVPDLFALSFPNATLDGFGGIPVVDLGQPGINGWPRFLKRAFDVAVVSIGLIAISPLLILIALAVKLDSPGPVLYRQPRIGEDGRLFTMFKYRSMRTNTDPAVHQAHVTRLIRENLDLAAAGANGGNGSLKLGNDPRVTRVGKFIRKTSLDELPQVLNVLRGEMSLVGPRPPLPYEVDLYQDWHKRRLDAIPGMTGLWQVKGRNRVSFDEMVRMDLEYIEHQSFWLDLKLIALTPLAMVTGRGAG